MTTQEVASQLVALCRAGRNIEAVDALLSDNVVSVEARGDETMPTEMTGRDTCFSGSSEAMERYLEEFHPERASKATVKKTRFGEIRRGMEMGAAYAFDQASYERFYPLAREAGFPVGWGDFEEAKKRNNRFFTVRLSWVQ